MNKQIFKKTAKIMRRALPLYYSQNKKSRLYYVKHFDSEKIHEKTILYEVRDGQSITDSPLAMFIYMTDQTEFQKWQHIWVVKESIDRQQILVNVPEKKHKFVQFVTRDSLEYSKWLLKAKYVVTNSTFNFFWQKRPGQIYINTWHGTPLKYMGYDIPGNKASLKNVQRNLLMTDFLLSPNEHTTHVFFDRYKLNGLYNGKILESGYPRNDLLQTKDETIREQLISSGIELANKPIVLYTPTWKGTSINNPAGSLEQIYAEITFLQKKHPELQILLKVHPYAYGQARAFSKLQPYLIPDQYDPSRILSITDILITDYSSIFFDFAITGRPIIFYAWDKEQYQNYRGMYLKDSELPGPVLDSIVEVSDYLSNHHSNVNYSKSIANMIHYDDGQVTKRIIERIFFGKESSKITEITTVADKIKLLIFSGGMVNNGISSSLINLTKNIDYAKYDVSILTYDGNQDEKVNNINRLDSRARIMYRMGTPAYTMIEQVRDLIITRFGVNKLTKFIYPKHAYQRESRRLLAGYQFDTAIDFSGYSFNGAKLIAEAEATNKVIFQHNDLSSDAHKVIDSRKPNYMPLMALFTIYFKFDKIVSVSKSLLEINNNKLQSYVKDEQLYYLKNTLDLSHKINSKFYEENIVIDDINRVLYLNNDVLNAYISIEHIRSNKNISYLTQGNHFRAISKLDYFGKIFYRITEEGLPSVWVDSSDAILDSKEYILSSSDVKKVGWLKQNNEFIQRNPFGAGDNNYIIGHGWLIQYTFIDILSEVQTTDGLYLKIKLPKTTLVGYIKANSVNILATSKMTYVQKIWNSVSNKRIEKKFIPTKQPIIISPNAKMSLQPQGLLKRFDKTIKHGELLPVKMADAKAVTTQGTFYRVSGIKKSLWVNANDVKLFDQTISFSGYQMTVSDISNTENECIYVSETSYFSTENFGEKITGKQVVAKFVTTGEIWYFVLDANYKLITIHDQNHKIVTVDTNVGLRAPKDIEDQILKKYAIDFNNIDLVNTKKPLPLGPFVAKRDHSSLVDESHSLDKYYQFNKIVSSDAFIFSTMGRFSPEKNQLMLIKAFLKIVKNMKQNAYLVFIGDGKLKNDLEELVSAYGISENVVFLGQITNPQEVISRTDAFVLPSAFEGQPMVLLEAMTLQVPIIASNIKANFDVLGNQKYGMIISDFSIDGLAEAMKNIMNNQYKFEKFDPIHYNKSIMKRFDSLVGVAARGNVKKEQNKRSDRSLL
ncbi:CDP-glycerol glycerophosphotransferase family protein [Leuconostoc carnosum]|uniref:CDP-glycerol glycerophosphotransferase family protein n=1 Tax=Leuconostoc carnosum TaxID=1252 RepID=UPI00388A9EB0